MINLNKQVFIGLLLMLIIVGCSTRPKVPRDLPSERKMAEVLADVYEVESLLGQTRINYNSDKKGMVSGYYRTVLDRHEMTKIDFDTAIAWYTANPTVLSDVYEEAIEILSKREADLKNKISKEKEERPSIGKLPNREELWTDTTTFSIPFDPKDSLDNRVPFNVAIDSLDGGILRLHANYTFKEGGFLDSAQLKMLVAYADSTVDTVSYQIHKSFKKVNGNISHSIGSDKIVINAEGFLFEHDTTKKSTVMIEDVKMTFIPTMKAGALMEK